MNKEKLAAHHDALEFPDGRTVLLTLLREGQAASVLQLPAQPKTEAEAASMNVSALSGERNPDDRHLRRHADFSPIDPLSDGGTNAPAPCSA